MVVTESPKRGALVEVKIAVSGRYAEGSVGTVDFEVSPGVKVESGPTRLTVKDWTEAGFHTLTVRVPESGDPVVRARIRVDSPLGVSDEGEYVLHLREVPREGETIAARATRLERIERGQRFRYAGTFRVPIAASETFTQDDLSRRGIKPSVVQSFKAECRGCTEEVPANASFVVFLDEQGRVTDFRPLDVKLEPAALAEARTALARWQFRSARLDNRAVADFVVVQLGFTRP
jgi:hypothetical protein